MKLKQTSLDQTGIAIIQTTEGDEYIPLFSLEPDKEARELVALYYKNNSKFIQLKACYITNNLMEVKIEDIIEKYMQNNLNLPEDYMEELISGFPFIKGLEPAFNKAYYA